MLPPGLPPPGVHPPMPPALGGQAQPGGRVPPHVQLNKMRQMALRAALLQHMQAGQPPAAPPMPGAPPPVGGMPPAGALPGR